MRVNEQLDLRFLVIEVVKVERNRHVVADAAYIDNHLVRFFGKQCAAEMRNHAGGIVTETDRTHMTLRPIALYLRRQVPRMKSEKISELTTSRLSVYLRCLNALHLPELKPSRRRRLPSSSAQLSPDQKGPGLFRRVWCAWGRLLRR